MEKQFNNSIKTFNNNFPDIETFNHHNSNYLPFLCIHPIELGRFVQAEDLLNINHSVDISCINLNEEEFIGVSTKREYVNMKLSSFAEGFIAALNNNNHWTHDIGLNLYLSQVSIYNSLNSTNNISQIQDYLPRIELLESFNIKAINLWMNLKLPTSSSLHYDEYNNLLIVYKGVIIK
jgi:hypothetical protein